MMMMMKNKVVLKVFFYLSTNHTKHKCTSAFRKYKVIRVAKMRRWKFAAIMHVSERGDYFV